MCANVFLQGLSYQEFFFDLEKIEREKDAGVLVGNWIDFKSMIQWGQKKGTCDLGTQYLRQVLLLDHSGTFWSDQGTGKPVMGKDTRIPWPQQDEGEEGI